MLNYSKEYYQKRNNWTELSVVSIMALIQTHYKPNSIIDFGCGSGSWLHTIKRLYQINDILGVDGYCIDEKELMIPSQNFKRYNLERIYVPDRRFDMAISMEVAEHLNERYADNFVTSLVNASDLILFSAAIPLQGGTNHINEQPQSYWKAKFSKKNYECIDIIRSRIWDHQGVRTDYKQNAFLYINKNQLNESKSLLYKFKSVEQESILDIVHPELFERKVETVGNLKVIGLKRVIKSLPTLILHAILNRARLLKFHKS